MRNDECGMWNERRECGGFAGEDEAVCVADRSALFSSTNDGCGAGDGETDSSVGDFHWGAVPQGGSDVIDGGVHQQDGIGIAGNRRNAILAGTARWRRHPARIEAGGDPAGSQRTGRDICGIRENGQAPKYQLKSVAIPSHRSETWVIGCIPFHIHHSTFRIDSCNSSSPPSALIVPDLWGI